MKKIERKKQRYTLWIESDTWEKFKSHCDENMIQKNLLLEELVKQYLDSKVYLNFK